MKGFKRFSYCCSLIVFLLFALGCTDGRPVVDDLRVHHISAEIAPIAESPSEPSGRILFSADYHFLLASDAAVPISVPFFFASKYFKNEKLSPSFSEVVVTVNGSSVDADRGKSKQGAKFLVVPLSVNNTKAGAYAVHIQFKVSGVGQSGANGEKIYFPITGYDFSVPVESFELRFVAPTGISVPARNVGVTVGNGTDRVLAKYEGRSVQQSNAIVVSGKHVPVQMEIGLFALW